MHRFATATLSLLALLPASQIYGQLTTITQAGSGETVQAMLSHTRSLAMTSDGRIWTVIHFNDGKGNGAKSQFLRIYSSSDNGKTWSHATTARAEGGIRGSLVTGTDGKTLHVAWRAFNGQVGSSVLYAPYDTVTGKWLGSDVVLAKGGSTTNQQYLEPQISVTAKGTLVVCFYQHRQGAFPAWSGAMTYNKGGSWTTPARVNVDTYGVLIDAMTAGEDVHFAYRTNSGLYGIRYRRFDTAADKWGGEGEQQVSQKNPANMRSSSGNMLAQAPNGDTYVLYALGDTAVGKGSIWVGYSQSGKYDFSTHVKVADDPPLQGGNFSYYNYTLSRSHDGRIYVLYSLASEGNANLYMRWLIAGKIFPSVPVRLVQGTTSQFTWIAGHRLAHGGFGFMATVRDTSHTGGRASFYGGQSNGAVVLHGRGCQGNLGTPPRLSADLPALGLTHNLALQDLPKSQPGIVFFGLSDKVLGGIPLPLDLTPLMMPGCFLVQDFFLTLGYAASSQGAAGVAIPFPNDPRLAGLPFYTQAFQIAPGANGQNALMTNGLSSIPR